MKKVLETGIEVVFAGLLAGCLFYCMVAGAGTTAYVIHVAAILSIAISVTLCAGFHYIRRLEEAAGGAGREAITGKHIVTSVFSPNPHLDKFHRKLGKELGSVHDE